MTKFAHAWGFGVGGGCDDFSWFFLDDVDLGCLLILSEMFDVDIDGYDVI